MLAHIAGIPVEETVLSFLPLTIATASAGIVVLRERARRRSYKLSSAEPQETREPRRSIEHHSPEPQR